MIGRRDDGFRSYGNENWEFDQNGPMRLRFAFVNDGPTKQSERKYHWPRSIREHQREKTRNDKSMVL
jgi:nuclear transport factor 2 (NTF2) superfamily protein